VPSNEYMREYMLKRYYARRKEAFKLLGGTCARCSTKVGLEIDHIKPRHKVPAVNISQMWK